MHAVRVSKRGITAVADTRIGNIRAQAGIQVARSRPDRAIQWSIGHEKRILTWQIRDWDWVEGQTVDLMGYSTDQ